jgi:hypothetical protein
LGCWWLILPSRSFLIGYILYPQVGLQVKKIKLIMPTKISIRHWGLTSVRNPTEKGAGSTSAQNPEQLWFCQAPPKHFCIIAYGGLLCISRGVIWRQWQLKWGHCTALATH